MNWTTPAELRAQTQRLWDKGRLLGALVDPGTTFPLRLGLKVPSSADLSDRFEAARNWSREIAAGARAPGERGYRLVWREVRHRVIGSNSLPAEAWLDTLEDALALIGRQREGRRFARLLAGTRTTVVSLTPWLHANPLRALALENTWSQLLAVIAWMRAHPRSGIYLRQVDLPGIHSKFIEEHRAVLSELLDLILPAHEIDHTASGLANFAQRYGFRNKPGRVRLRVLDERHPLLQPGVDEDIAVSQELFARLDPGAVSRIFVTENEINFLAFPAVPDSWVIFGSGYGFNALAKARWVADKAVHYWGDIDTHGFAILDQLRSHHAHVQSLLMDRATLLQHRSHWSDEPEPVVRDLVHLSAEERSLFDDLRWKRLCDGRVRLEQERIGFGWVERTLHALSAARSDAEPAPVPPGDPGVGR